MALPLYAESGSACFRKNVDAWITSNHIGSLQLLLGLLFNGAWKVQHEMEADPCGCRVQGRHILWGWLQERR